MNKIRMNPRGQNKPQSESSTSSIETSKVASKDLDETLRYFLDKNTNEFTSDEIQRFQNAHKKEVDLFLETSNEVIKKLFDITKVLAEKDPKVNENLIREDFIVKNISSLPQTFTGLELLITEILEDNNEDNMSFLTILIKNLINVDELLNKEEESIELLYKSLSEMLYELQSFNILQQKYIYREIASAINNKLTNYNLISPEEGNFVDPKFHKTVSGSGQRITRGLSYILLDTNNEEVLKFGNVKTI